MIKTPPTKTKDTMIKDKKYYPLDGFIDYPKNSSNTEKILKELGTNELIEIRRFPVGPLGQCYWNVDAVIKRQGGRRVDGWMISWLPDFYIIAMHHSAWEAPSGEMVDVSPPETEHPEGLQITCFSPIAELKDIAWPPMVESVHILLNSDPSLEKHRRAYKRNHAAVIERQKILQAFGAIFIPQQGVGFDNSTANNPAFQRAMQEIGKVLSASTAEMRQERSKFFNLYNSLGGGGRDPA